MITPSFSVAQSPDHIIVKVRLASIHCRVSDAQFDICDERFTLYCKPYYLRLTFDQRLVEGRDERATYNIDTNTLTVYAPKCTPGEDFSNLHDPAYLIATEKQRSAMKRGPLIQVLQSTAGAEGSESDEDDETEYVQTLQDADRGSDAQDARDSSVSSSDGAACYYYGFNNEFSNVFGSLDDATVYDAIDLRRPDTVSAHERRELRMASEAAAFNEDAMWCSLADEEGDVEHLLHGPFVPYYVRTFEDVLARDGVAYIVPPRRRAPEGGWGASRDASCGASLPREAAEVDASAEGVLMGNITEREVQVWNGNIASFEVLTNNEESESPGGAQSGPVRDDCDDLATSLVTPLSPETPEVMRRRIAAPRHPMEAAFEQEELDMLTRLAPATSRLSGRRAVPLLQPNEGRVAALTLDILLAYVYDHLTTEGASTAESVWTLCKLSPALSWLDPQGTIYDVCVVFARRALAYPLHRHLDLIRRCFRDAGIIMLLGPSFVVKALLAVKYILDHSEHKMVLSAIFINPLLAFWQRKARNAAVAMLHGVALELHEVATRSTPARSRNVRQHLPDGMDGGDQRTAAVQRLCAPKLSAEDALEYPITVTTLGLNLTV